jgi:glycosyltransferase involved in cell wall biosynthesis
MGPVLTAMRVLYVIDSLAAGGAERSLAALAPGYLERGVELEVAYLHDRPGLQHELLDAGARLHLVPAPTRRRRVGALTELIRDRRPQLVHTTLFEADIAGRIAARRARIPVVSSLVNVAYGPEHRADPNVGRWRLRAAQAADVATARCTVSMHAVSRFVADVMARRLRYPRERIVVIPRGRDAARLGRRTPERRAAARAALGLDASTPMVLAVARQEFQKGLDTLVESAALLVREIPQLRVVVAGREGSLSSDLRAHVDALGLSSAVELLGERDDIADLLCAADLFVLPSRREGLPGAVLEAMALETPIIASDLPQVREVVDDSTAVLVPSDAPERLATAMAGVLAASDDARTRASAARDRFEAEFTIPHVTDRMVTFYRDTLESLRTS